MPLTDAAIKNAKPREDGEDGKHLKLTDGQPLRLPEAISTCGLSHSSVCDAIQLGRFPAMGRRTATAGAGWRRNKKPHASRHAVFP
ncbi:hypothetical protein QR66_18075 [Chromobacterium piscinae]|nr:hypothetical protein QR66_18075 [Chromobacterium piscinae]